MTSKLRRRRVRPLGLCVLVCAMSTATGCGSLWPFTSNSATDPVEAKAQANKSKLHGQGQACGQGQARRTRTRGPIRTRQYPGRRQAKSLHFLTPWKWETFHPKAPPGEAETLVLHGNNLEPEKVHAGGKKPPTKAIAELSGAHELYRLGDYEKAQKIFHRIADDTKPYAAADGRGSAILRGRVPPPAMEVSAHLRHLSQAADR